MNQSMIMTMMIMTAKGRCTD